jgi:hypothetical protein
LDSSFKKIECAQRVWHILHSSHNIQKCAVCKQNSVLWDKRNRSYFNTCSKKCSAADPDRIKKYKSTMLKTYGVENPSHSDEILLKKAENYKESYSDTKNKEIVQKRFDTICDRYNVDSISDFYNSEQRIAKIKQTCKQKYGVETYLLHPEIDKIFKIKYGVDKINFIQQKAKESIIEKYSTDNIFLLDHIKEIRIKNIRKKEFNKRLKNNEFAYPLFSEDTYSGISSKSKTLWKCKNCLNDFTDILHSSRTLPLCPYCTKKGISNFEKEVRNFVIELLEGTTNISFNDRSILNGKEIDILVDNKIGIELNGAYWHSELAGKRDKNYHYNKTRLAAYKNIDLFHIWDFEWNNKKEICKSYLSSMFGKNEKIFARKCKIIKITKSEAANFFTNTHFQGFNKSLNTENFGLVFNDELAACISFTKSRFDSNSQVEIYRFSNKLYSNVIGGFGKLLKYYIDKQNPESIVSYCDLSKFKGTIYKKFGMQHSHNSSPNYFYTQNYIRFYSRHKFQKHKLKNNLLNFCETMTEWENMMQNGFDRIWDCGNAVFEYKYNKKDSL